MTDESHVNQNHSWSIKFAQTITFFVKLLMVCLQEKINVIDNVLDSDKRDVTCARNFKNPCCKIMNSLA